MIQCEVKDIYGNTESVTIINSSLIGLCSIKRINLVFLSSYAIQFSIFWLKLKRLLRVKSLELCWKSYRTVYKHTGINLSFVLLCFYFFYIPTAISYLRCSPFHSHLIPIFIFIKFIVFSLYLNLYILFNLQLFLKKERDMVIYLKSCNSSKITNW